MKTTLQYHDHLDVEQKTGAASTCLDQWPIHPIHPIHAPYPLDRDAGDQSLFLCLNVAVELAHCHS